MATPPIRNISDEKDSKGGVDRVNRASSLCAVATSASYSLYSHLQQSSLFQLYCMEEINKVPKNYFQDQTKKV